MLTFTYFMKYLLFNTVASRYEACKKFSEAEIIRIL